jgi:TRAP-type C4-dicarboxylate transport system permease small subunit
MRGVDAITKAMMVFTAFCALGIAFWILLEVVARNTNLHIYGAAEYISNFLIVIVFLQLPYAVRTRGMLAVDIFIDNLPARAGVPVYVMANLLGIFFFGAGALGSVGPAVEAWVEGQYEGEGVVDVPAWPAKFSIVIGCGFAAFYYLVRIVETFRSGRVEAESPDAPSPY